MAPTKKIKVEKEGIRRKEMITVEVKKEIIGMHEQGMQVAAIARYYNKSTSTICTILKNKEQLMRLDVAKGVTRISKQRPRILEDIEKFLLEWIKEQQREGDAVTEQLICEKAKALYADLVCMQPGTSAGNEEGGFKASRGWFDNFKRRSGIQNDGLQRYFWNESSSQTEGSISTGNGVPHVNMPHNHVPDPHSVALARCRQSEDNQVTCILDDEGRTMNFASLVKRYKDYKGPKSDPRFKQTVILCAEQSGNRIAAERFGVPYSTLRRWRRFREDIFGDDDEYLPSKAVKYCSTKARILVKQEVLSKSSSDSTEPTPRKKRITRAS
ncbi:PREDICTED: uncharacterized protein LOC108559608, partial [Nicrophorus vespilloides]|uniref:Uncharacterized protein LOC108559608 n=1 Tax=Nicrophorus vespilloides TaxID=110193 RepID=A0ABM1MCX6_NICVS